MGHIGGSVGAIYSKSVIMAQVDIVMPLYNKAATVKRAIDDLVAQLLHSMSPRHRGEFSGVLNHEFFSVTIEEGETIVDWV